MYRLCYLYINYNYGMFVVLTSICFYYIGSTQRNHMRRSSKWHGFDMLCILEIDNDRESLYNTWKSENANKAMNYPSSLMYALQTRQQVIPTVEYGGSMGKAFVPNICCHQL